MRISDWSSDVCSSDLGSNSRCHVSRGQAVTLKLVRIEPDAHGILRAEHDRIADTVDATERILKLRGNNVAKIVGIAAAIIRSEEHTSELQSLMRISYAVFCLKKKKT